MYIQYLFNPNHKKKLKGNKLIDNSKNLNSVIYFQLLFFGPDCIFFTDQNHSCWWMFESLFWKSPIGICWNVWSKNRQMGKTAWSAISTEWGQNGAFGWSSNNFWRLWWSNSKWTFDPISWQIEGMDPTSYNSNENS